MAYLKHRNGLEVSTGNSKVKAESNGKKQRTMALIINPGSCKGCPSRAFCKVKEMNRAGVCVDCYGEEAENHRDSVMHYRFRNEFYWETHTTDEIIRDLHETLSVKFRGIARGRRIEMVRFAEAGDVRHAGDVEKYLGIAKYLRETWDIPFIWSYTANADLVWLFDGNPWMTVKCSGNVGPMGSTCVIIGDDTPVPAGFVACKENCAKCKLCAVKGISIAFRYHGGTKNIGREYTREEGMAIFNRFYGESFPESIFRLPLAA